jgi:tetrahydromethanopterin S-methyltransferase subunit D
LKNWNNSPAPPSTANSPTLTKATLSISGDPTDTFITTVGWGDGNRGVVFVNGFNIGRYSGIGPTKTLYIPAPLLNRGDNTVRDYFSLAFFYFTRGIGKKQLTGKISAKHIFTCRFWYGLCSSP